MFGRFETYRWTWSLRPQQWSQNKTWEEQTVTTTFIWLYMEGAELITDTSARQQGELWIICLHFCGADGFEQHFFYYYSEQQHFNLLLCNLIITVLKQSCIDSDTSWSKMLKMLRNAVLGLSITFVLFKICCNYRTILPHSIKWRRSVKHLLQESA